MYRCHGLRAQMNGQNAYCIMQTAQYIHKRRPRSMSAHATHSEPPRLHWAHVGFQWSATYKFKKPYGSGFVLVCRSPIVSTLRTIKPTIFP